MEDPEIWRVKNIAGSTLVRIISNKSDLFIADKLLLEHARLICNLFNKLPRKKIY